MSSPGLLRPALALAAFAACAGCEQGGSLLQPGLVSLAVSPPPLTPTYSPGATDYYVTCGHGTNDLAVSYLASSETSVSISTPRGPVAAGAGSANVTVAENDLITVQVRYGSTTQSYYIRCLPADFPQMTFAPHPGTRTPGWYLTGNAQVAQGESGYAMALDPNGVPVWYERVGANGVFDVNLQPNGDLSYIADLGAYGTTAGAADTLQSLDPPGMSKVTAVGADTDEHELQMLPNGDWLITTYPLLPNVDLTGVPDTQFTGNWTIANCTIQEISPAGALVWEWVAYDHVDPVKEGSLPQVNVVNGVPVADVFHLNSIDVDSNGNLLVSMRDMDAVYYVERPSGKILWKLGWTGADTKDGEPLIKPAGDPEGSFHRQHDARLQPGGSVSLFDDHDPTSIPPAVPTAPARAVEYQLDMTSLTAKVIWQYQTPFAPNVPSVALGSFRRYGGTNVICWGLPWINANPNAPTFSEVTDDGVDLLDMTFGHRDAAYRAVKVPLSALDAATLRANTMVNPPDPVETAQAAHLVDKHPLR